MTTTEQPPQLGPGAGNFAPLPGPTGPAYGQARPPAELAPAAPAPLVSRAVPLTPAADVETLTCPECGTVAYVTVNRRDASDFCRTCDYPLFWTPSVVIRDRTDANIDDSLRRLPGQRGRAMVASTPCPHCSELNSITAEVCIRCGLPMHLIAAPPPIMTLPQQPAPVVLAPAPPPEPGVAWWVWALLALGAVVLITLVILIATGTIH